MYKNNLLKVFFFAVGFILLPKMLLSSDNTNLHKDSNDKIEKEKASLPALGGEDNAFKLYAKPESNEYKSNLPDEKFNRIGKYYKDENYDKLLAAKRNKLIIKIVIAIICALFIFFLFRYFKSLKINLKQYFPQNSQQEIPLKNISTELEKINTLKTEGIITNDEFLKLKKRIIN